MSPVLPHTVSCASAKREANKDQGKVVRRCLEFPWTLHTVTSGIYGQRYGGPGQPLERDRLSLCLTILAEVQRAGPLDSRLMLPWLVALMSSFS